MKQFVAVALICFVVTDASLLRGPLTPTGDASEVLSLLHGLETPPEDYEATKEAKTPMSELSTSPVEFSVAKEDFEDLSESAYETGIKKPPSIKPSEAKKPESPLFDKYKPSSSHARATAESAESSLPKESSDAETGKSEVEPMNLPKDGNFLFYGVTLDADQAHLHTISATDGDNGTVRLIVPAGEFFIKPFVLRGTNVTLPTESGLRLHLLRIEQDGKDGLFLLVNGRRIAFVDVRAITAEAIQPLQNNHLLEGIRAFVANFHHRDKQKEQSGNHEHSEDAPTAAEYKQFTPKDDSGSGEDKT